MHAPPPAVTSEADPSVRRPGRLSPRNIPIGRFFSRPARCHESRPFTAPPEDDHHPAHSSSRQQRASPERHGHRDRGADPRKARDGRRRQALTCIVRRQNRSPTEPTPPRAGPPTGHRTDAPTRVLPRTATTPAAAAAEGRATVYGACAAVYGDGAPPPGTSRPLTGAEYGADTARRSPSGEPLSAASGESLSTGPVPRLCPPALRTGPACWTAVPDRRARRAPPLPIAGCDACAVYAD